MNEPLPLGPSQSLASTSARSGLTERAFRRYEHVIRHAIAAYPRTILVQPRELAPATFVARLRDAIASLRKFKWNTDWEYTDLKLKDLAVLVQSNGIHVGPRNTRPIEVEGIVHPGRTKLSRDTTLPHVLIPDPTPEQLEAYCLLATSHPTNLGPLAVTRTAQNAHLRAVLSSLEDVYDIAVVDHPTQWIVF